jgi:hypothetical protein
LLIVGVLDKLRGRFAPAEGKDGGDAGNPELLLLPLLFPKGDEGVVFTGNKYGSSVLGSVLGSVLVGRF